MSERFIKFIPSQKATWLREKEPNAFLLLSYIAEIARRSNGQWDGLEVGECLVTQNVMNWSRQKCRTAIDKLESLGYIQKIHNGKKFLGNDKLEFERRKSTIKITIKCTLVKLVDTSIYDINQETSNQRCNQRATNEQPTSNHKQECTKKEKEEEKEKIYKKEKIIEIQKIDPDDPLIQVREKVHITQRRIDLLRATYDDEVTLNRAFDKLNSYYLTHGVKDAPGEPQFGRLTKGGWVFNAIEKEKKEAKTLHTKNNSISELETRISKAKEYSQKIAKEFYSPHCEIQIVSDGINFIPLTGANITPEKIMFREFGFTDQVNNLLRKRGFNKKIVNEQNKAISN